MPRAVWGSLQLSGLLLSLAFLVLPSVDAFLHQGSRINVTYAWKTGDWGACLSGAESCGEGQQERNVWCADSEGLTVLDQSCDVHSRPKDKINCLLLCDRIKPYLWWEVGEWSPCSLPPAPGCAEGLGVSRRNVSCYYGPPERPPQEVAVSVCDLLPDKPPLEIPCSYECPRDCVTGEWTDRTHCGDCGGGTVVNRTRTRRVLVAPEYGGKLCPDLTEFLPCNSSEVCPQDASVASRPVANQVSYVLKVGSWSPCKAGKAAGKASLRKGFIQSPVFGVKTRKVVCVDHHGVITDMKKCMLKAEVPPSEEWCLTSVHCSVSPWSEWRVLQEGCNNSLGQVRPETRIRSRRVMRLAQGGGRPCPQLAEEKVLRENLPPCNSRYVWLPLEWGECEIFKDPLANSSELYCGEGRQAKTVICTKAKDLVPVPEWMCFEPRPHELQRCHVTCRRPCRLSPWSSWDLCLPGKGIHHFEMPSNGYRLRSRKVLDEGSDPGACAHLYEKEKCDDPEKFTWTYGTWGRCQVEQNKTCGSGEKNRKVTCTLLNGEPTSEVYCRMHLNIPEDNETCYVPCPEDCVLSEWTYSTCSQRCYNNKEGEVKMTRTVLAPAGPEGEPCEEDLSDRDACNLWSCEGFSWQTTPWGPCQATQGTAKTQVPGKPPCGAGLQTRRVWCAHKDQPAKKDACHTPEKPRESQKCRVPCAIDCNFTEFSDWSPCPDKCSPTTTQTRERYVIQGASDGGAACPQILQEKRSCYEDNNPACYRPNNTYKWVADKWSHCQPLARHPKKCGMGLQIREVFCQQSDSQQAVELWNCLEGQGSDPPEQVRSCELLCDSNCSLTDWVSKSSCGESCSTTVHEEKILIGAEKTGSECEQMNAARIRRCPPVEEVLEQGPWQDCILEEVQDCGTGIRYRIAPGSDAATCQQTGIQKESCHVDCPVDCIMSAWAKWSACNTRCGPGYRERSRVVIQAPNSLGRPCSPGTVNGTEEVEEVCEQPCDEFVWLSEGWSTCHVQGAPCGNGTQKRRIKCARSQPGHLSQVVAEERCDPSEKPPATRDCQLTCPGDCLVSEWAPWTACKAPCKDSGERTREREVLRRPSPSGASCPDLVQRESCHLGVNCFKLSWVLGPWGSCSLPPGARCGRGTKQRALMCQSAKDGAGVNPKLCQGLSPVLDEHLVQNCTVDCPVDCRLSPWSEWDDHVCTPCSAQGLQVRRRLMLQAPSSSGRPCPSLFQNKPCPFSSCFHWEIGNWSSCQIPHPGQCGYGTRSRSVVCIRSDGVQLDDVHCLRVNASLTTRLAWVDNQWLRAAEDAKSSVPCHVPCPGDCLVSEWSEWGHCERDCDNNNNNTVGYQTRSRSVLSFSHNADAEPCPKDLYETKPCSGGPCLTFEWTMVDNVLKCVRSDGLVVSEAGCTSSYGGKRRLQGNWSCVLRPCQVTDSTCQLDTGHCVCRMGYAADHDPLTGHLNRCSPMDDIRPDNHTGARAPEVNYKYYPDDKETSFWMYAMISVGTAFVIFVAVTIYLMCHSSLRERLVDVRRQGNMRRRPPLPTCHLPASNGTPKNT